MKKIIRGDMDFGFVFVIMIAIGPEKSIPVDMDDLCHEDMTGKRGENVTG